MKLATKNNGSRDGELLIVSRDGKSALSATDVAPTLQSLMDNWAMLAPKAADLYEQLNQQKLKQAFSLDYSSLMSPLPRAYSWIDGSAYLNHVILVRRARGAEVPPTLKTDPLMYQGGSDSFLAPRQDIAMATEEWGIDFESEVVVVTDDVPMGTTAEKALKHIKLVGICNDVSLRNLIPAELAKGFGFLQSKPSSAFAPFFVTPDELGVFWKEGRVHLPLQTWLNGKLYGDPNAGPEMHFSFGDLVAHIAKTRSLGAGAIVGSGTVSNEGQGHGSSCLAEQRMVEKIQTGEMKTPFLKFGDRVRIEMFKDEISIFGAIDQKVTLAT